MAGLVTQSKRAPLAERGDDLYETPPAVTRALCRNYCLPQRVWEPACGRGAMVAVLRDEEGLDVVATDLNDHGWDGAITRVDFLMEQAAPEGVDTIVTNPPYKLANEFARHALKLCPHVCLFLRLAWLESMGRADLLDAGSGFKYLMPFKARVPMMHRDGWQGSRSSSAVAFAWFIWERGFAGAPTVTRLDLVEGP